MRMRISFVLFVASAVSGAPLLLCQATAAPAGQKKEIVLDQKEVLRQIKVCEDALHNAEATHAAPATLAKIEVTIGDLYEDVRALPQAEDALERAVKLLRGGPPGQLANALGEMATLHILMGDTHKAEKEDREELALIENTGDSHQIALAHVDLANAEIKDRSFNKAVEDAQKAMDVLGSDAKVAALDRIAARQTLGYALSGAGRCSEAMPMIYSAMDLARTTYGADSLAVGMDYYLLGHAAWQCGLPADAAAWMQRGIDRMKVDLGWGHVVYLTAVAEYAKFLRERGQTEQAAAEEREVRMVQSTVDARTLAPANGLR